MHSIINLQKIIVGQFINILNNTLADQLNAKVLFVLINYFCFGYHIIAAYIIATITKNAIPKGVGVNVASVVPT